MAPQSSTFSLDADPADRRGDRLLARLGLLEDAAPLFGSAKAAAGAGVLLALPAPIPKAVERRYHDSPFAKIKRRVAFSRPDTSFLPDRKARRQLDRQVDPPPE